AVLPALVDPGPRDVDLDARRPAPGHPDAADPVRLRETPPLPADGRGIVSVMANPPIGLPPDVHDYLVKHGVREPELLRRLRDETLWIPQHNTQLTPAHGHIRAR